MLLRPTCNPSEVLIDHLFDRGIFTGHQPCHDASHIFGDVIVDVRATEANRRCSHDNQRRPERIHHQVHHRITTLASHDTQALKKNPDRHQDKSDATGSAIVGRNRRRRFRHHDTSVASRFDRNGYQKRWNPLARVPPYDIRDAKHRKTIPRLPLSTQLPKTHHQITAIKLYVRQFTSAQPLHSCNRLNILYTLRQKQHYTILVRALWLLEDQQRKTLCRLHLPKHRQHIGHERQGELCISFLNLMLSHGTAQGQPV